MTGGAERAEDMPGWPLPRLEEGAGLRGRSVTSLAGAGREGAAWPTVTMAWQPGQRTFLPASFSSARRDLPQPQTTVIDIGISPTGEDVPRSGKARAPSIISGKS